MTAIRILVKAPGCDVNQVTKGGATPACIAARISSYYGLNGSGQVGASRQPVTRGLAERPTRRNGSGRVGAKNKPRVTANLAKLKT